MAMDPLHMKRINKRQRGAAATTTTTEKRRPTTTAARTTTTKARAATTAAATTTTTPKAATTTSAVTTTTRAASLATTPTTSRTTTTSRPLLTSSSSATALPTASPDQRTSSPNHTGTIVGVVVAIIAALAVVFGLIFFFRRRRANRVNAANGGAFAGASNAGFKKHKDEDDDELFGSAAGGHEKGNSFGNHHGMVQSSGSHPSWEAPSYSSHGHNGAMNGAMAAAAGGMVAAGAAQQSSANLLAKNGSAANDEHSRIEQREMQQHLENQQHSFAVSPQVAKAAGAAGAGAANPFGAETPGQGSIHIVKRTFEPTLSDELVLAPGDRVQLLVRYDDGWALGINLDAASPPGKGVFPFDCLGEASQGSQGQGQPGVQPLSTIAESGESRPSSLAQAQPQSQPNRPESQTYLSYQTGAPAAGLPKTSEAPQLPNFLSRSDSPLTFAPGAKSNLPVLGAPVVPSIQISDPSSNMLPTHSTNNGQRPISTSSLPSSLQPGGQSSGNDDQNGNRDGAKVRRTSSLIASRDADLFMALGEVLDRDSK